MKYIYYLIVNGNPVDEVRISYQASKDDILFNHCSDYDFSTDQALIGGCWYDYDDITVERMC